MNNKLNAYVRFDGSGKIVPSSVILQRTKPKVGNWKQIDSSECCNYTTTTTSTTTTVIVYTFNSQFSETSNYDLCTNPSYDPNLYSVSSTLGIGAQLFSSDALDIPIIDGWYVVDDNTYHVTGGNGFITELGIPCSEIFVNVTNRFVDCAAPCEQPCAEPWDYFNVYMTLICSLNFPTVGCEIWENGSGTIPFPDGIYNNGNGNCITITDGVITNIV